MIYRCESYFCENNITTKFGVSVSQIDFDSKQVILESGEQITYDKLLISTGGTPIFPPITGNDAEGVFSFTSLKDANNIATYIQENKVESVVVLGGGLIGLKATEALMDLKLKVTVVELMDRILSATFDKKASNIIENALKAQNCQVMTEDTIDSIENENGKVCGVTLKSGTQVPCQMVIVAIGVRPNIALVKDTAIQTNKGIVVNDSMQTSVPDVYAAGDVAEAKGWVIAILPVAARQGKIAGYNMADQDRKYDGSTPKNAVELAGIPTISVGLTDPKENLDEYEILEKYLPKQNTYKKIVLHENVIVGVIFVNEIDRAGIYTGLIKDQVDVTSFKDNLLNDDFGLVSLPKDYRKKTLISGGAVSDI